MGKYINIGNAGFQWVRNGEFIDKSLLISAINQALFTENCLSCVSRCRRFGKSLAAKMLCAYYDQSCDSRQLFADLVLMPRKGVDRPAILIELKKDLSANAAIGQIHRKEYKGKVADYGGRIILVGINYDSKTKKHECQIEQI